MIDELKKLIGQCKMGDTAICIETGPERLGDLVNIIVKLGYLWCGTHIPEVKDIEKYAKKPVPGIIVYSNKHFLFNELPRRETKSRYRAYHIDDIMPEKNTDYNNILTLMECC